MKYVLIVCVSAMSLSSCAQSPNIPDRDDQLASAVLAAPEEDRADATVMGYDAEGNLVE